MERVSDVNGERVRWMELRACFAVQARFYRLKLQGGENSLASAEKHLGRKRSLLPIIFAKLHSQVLHDSLHLHINNSDH